MTSPAAPSDDEIEAYRLRRQRHRLPGALTLVLTGTLAADVECILTSRPHVILGVPLAFAGSVVVSLFSTPSRANAAIYGGALRARSRRR